MDFCLLRIRGELDNLWHLRWAGLSRVMMERKFVQIAKLRIETSILGQSTFCIRPKKDIINRAIGREV